MGSHRTVQGLQLTLSCWDRNQEKAMFTHELPNPNPNPSSRDKLLEDVRELFFHLSVG